MIDVNGKSRQRKRWQFSVLPFQLWADDIRFGYNTSMASLSASAISHRIEFDPTNICCESKTVTWVQFSVEIHSIQLIGRARRAIVILFICFFFSSLFCPKGNKIRAYKNCYAHTRTSHTQRGRQTDRQTGRDRQTLLDCSYIHSYECCVIRLTREQNIR